MVSSQGAESSDGSKRTEAETDLPPTNAGDGGSDGADAIGGERKRLAEAKLRRALWFGGAAGIVPVPLLDLVLITSVQVKLIADLSEIYDVPFAENSVKASVASLVGGVVPVSSVAGGSASLVKTIPVFGPLIGMAVVPAFAAATTWAVGRVFIAHFESGGSLLDFDAETYRDLFRQEFDKAKKRPKTA